MENIEYQKRVMQRFFNEQKRLNGSESRNETAPVPREKKICTKQPYQLPPKPSINSSISSELDPIQKDGKDYFYTENWFKIETKSFKNEQSKS